MNPHIYAHIDIGAALNSKFQLPHHDEKAIDPCEFSSVNLDNLIRSIKMLPSCDMNAEQKRSAYFHLSKHAHQFKERGLDDSRLDFFFETEETSWLEDLAKSDDPEFVSVGPTKIFRSGTWNGHEYTKEDIDEIVANFNLFRNSFLPALKCGHNQGMFLIDDQYSEKAHGYVTDMWAEGETIYAVFEFPIWFYIDTIKSKELRYKSVEIYPTWEYNGIERENVITGVGLLGINPPAVADLGEIVPSNADIKVYNKIEGVSKRIFTFDSETGNERNEQMADNNTSAVLEPEVETDIDSTQDVSVDEPVVEPTQEPTQEPAPESDSGDEDLEAQRSFQADLKANFEKQMEEMQKKLAETLENERAKYQKELADAQNIIKEYQKEKHVTEIERNVEDLVRGGHVAPAKREVCKELFNAVNTCKAIKFSAGEKEFTNAKELLVDFLKSYSVVEMNPVTMKNSDLSDELENSTPDTANTDESSRTYDGETYKTVNGDKSRKAKEYRAKVLAETGKEISFVEAYETLFPMGK